MGFYNFSFSLVVFFLVVGYWIRHREQLGPRHVLTLTFLILLLNSCHLLSVVAALVLIVILATCATVVDIAAGGRRADPGAIGRPVAASRRLLVSLAAFLPTLALAAYFLARQQIGESGPLIAWSDSPVRPVAELLSLDALISYDRVEAWLAAALAGLFGVTACCLLAGKAIRRRVEAPDALLVVAAAYVVVHLLAPDQLAGGGFVKARTALLPLFALLLWFGSQSYGRFMRAGIQIVAASIAVAWVGVHLHAYGRIGEYYDEYVSLAPSIEENSTVLPLSFSQYEDPGRGQLAPGRVGVCLHPSGYVAVQRRVVDLSDYAGTVGYFCVRPIRLSRR
jgi:hypothetical protein